MSRWRIDISRLRAKNSALRGEVPRAAEELLREGVRAAVGFMVNRAPKDTNRYARAWQVAALRAGAGGINVLPVKPSGFMKAADVEGRQRQHLARWERTLAHQARARLYWFNVYENRYVRTGRKGRWRDDAMRKLKAAEWREARAAEIVKRIRENLAVLASDPSAVVIFGRRKKVAAPETSQLPFSDKESVKFQRKLDRAAYALGQVDRVIAGTYGGSGEVVRGETRVVIILKNLEPHARIVERQHRLVLRSISVAKQTTRAAGGRHIRRLTAREARSVENSRGAEQGG